MINRITIYCIIILFACSGCSWFEKKKEQSADELIHNGMTAFENGKYRKAIESFEKIKDWYPFSKYAILAELKMADSYYHLEEYEDAILFYEEFESLHPRNEAVPEVIYQIGMCYFNRMEVPDRDQTSTQKAMDTFRRLKREYPNSPFAQKADERIYRCRENLARHEFSIANYYLKTGHPKAAMERFRMIISFYPDVSDVYKKAEQYIESLAKE